MGRHSAPDDDDTRDDSPGTAVAVVDAPGPPGRHANATATADQDAPTQRYPQPAPAVAEPAGLDLIEEVLQDEPPRADPPAPVTPPPTAHPEAATAQLPAVVDHVDAPARQTTTDLIPVITEPILDQPAAAPAEAPSAPSAPKGPSVPKGMGHTASAADLTLVREHADVRARCIAALIAPFLIYVVVLFAIGLLDSRKALFLLFAPLIVAGVLVGLFLDLGHRRYATAAPPAAASEPSTPR